MFMSILNFLKEKNTQKNGAFRLDYAVMIGGIVIGVAIIVFAVVFGERSAPTSSSLRAFVPTDGRTGLELGTAPVLGNADAPHTILEFFDFQCIACGKYFTQIEPQIIKEFIDTGKAKLVVKPLHFIDDYAGVGVGVESRRSAIASLCAQREGKFWDMYTAIFTAEQDEVRAGKQNENSGNLTEEFFINTAQTMGLSPDSFAQCLSSNEYDTALQEYFQDAMAALQGQISTPSVFVDGNRLKNPFNLDEYRKFISDTNNE